MFSDTQVLVLYVSFLTVSVTGVAVLYRKLSEIRRLLPQSSTTPPPDTDLRFLFLVAISVTVVAFSLIFVPENVSSWAVRLGFRDNETRPLGVWLTADPGRYQWHAFDLENVTRYPLVECAQFTHALELQEILLGPLPLPPLRGAHDPAVEYELRERVAQEDRLRVRARKRCVLNPPSEHLILDPKRMQYLTDARQPSLVAALRKYVESPDAEPIQPVNHFLQARDGTRYLSVLVVVPNSTNSLPTELRVERRLIRDDDLLQVPKTWYHEDCMNPVMVSGSCVCPAHFGILGSGIYFHYELENTVALAKKDEVPTADERKVRCQGKWKLWMRSRVVRDVGSTKVATYKMNYHALGTGFPLRVIEKLDMFSFRAADSTDVEYLDLAAMMDTTLGSFIIDNVDPNWLTPNLPMVNKSSAPLLSVLSLDEFMKKEGAHVHRLGDNTNHCFNYCLQVDEQILRSAGVV